MIFSSVGRLFLEAALEKKEGFDFTPNVLLKISIFTFKLSDSQASLLKKDKPANISGKNVIIIGLGNGFLPPTFVMNFPSCEQI